tara:strand:- start:2516 stop:3256 length:741 start_codon:yes stop_codon:yes gene_type:complete
MAKNHMQQKMTPREVSEAIFVDFEGAKSDENGEKFLGILWNPYSDDSKKPRLRQYILDPNLTLCAKAKIYDATAHVSCEKHEVKYFFSREQTEKEAVEFLLRLQNGKARIVSWSLHDWNILENIMGKHGFDDEQRMNIKERWRNAISTAQSWGEANGLNTAKGQNELDLYLETLNYEIPSFLTRDSTPGNKLINDRMKKLSNLQMKKKKISDLSEKQKGYWRHICEYNFHDLEGMRQVLLKAVMKS